MRILVAHGPKMDIVALYNSNHSSDSLTVTLASRDFLDIAIRTDIFDFHIQPTSMDESCHNQIIAHLCVKNTWTREVQTKVQSFKFMKEKC